MKVQEKYALSDHDVGRIVEMGWEDRTPFEAIEFQFGVSEKDVIRLMRDEMKPSSWRLWRKRVQNRSTKHLKKRTFEFGRFRCSQQSRIHRNKASQRR